MPRVLRYGTVRSPVRLWTILPAGTSWLQDGLNAYLPLYRRHPCRRSQAVRESGNVKPSVRSLQQDSYRLNEFNEEKQAGKNECGLSRSLGSSHALANPSRLLHRVAQNPFCRHPCPDSSSLIDFINRDRRPWQDLVVSLYFAGAVPKLQFDSVPA